MTTLLESRARPFGSSKGAVVSMVLHGLLIGAAVLATAHTVLPPREKIEEHPILYVASPPPKPLPETPKPLPKVEPPKAKVKSPVHVARREEPRRPEPPRPRPAPAVQPKGPSTPALVAPTKIALSIPAPNMAAPPTVSDVVAPPVSEPASSSVPRGGTVSSSGGDVEPRGGGLGSGASGKAYDENQVDRAVEVTRQASARYPDALKSVGVEGTVSMRFIVSADGKVEPGSIEVISTSHPLFAAAVRTALLNTRYRPAEAGGQKVRQLVEQSFSFKLDKQ